MDRHTMVNHFKVIFFDLGNVLVHVFPERTIRRLAVLLNTTERAVEAMWQDNQLHFSEFEKGLITSQKLFNRVFKNNGTIQADDFFSAFTMMFELNRHVADLAKMLSRSYRLSIISNTNKLHFDKINSDYSDVMALFTHPITSFETHVQKPDAEIYRYALEKLNCAPKEAILIDDKEENVVAAHENGIYGIQYSSIAKLQRELIKLGAM